ncbi:hypothetical protein [Psychrobacter jeotgali]|uniref:hypothetical protein n=1 Tax=Psychrobacter jeotgali TaxID=179010 RepID=UPI00191987B4|nr:hypothetical protein [Psychrobacter jeotgali]
MSAGLALSGCSEMNTVMTDLQNSSTSAVASQSVPQVNKVSPKPTEKLDLVGLVGWFEDSCGFDNKSYTEGTQENLIGKRFDAFKETFMEERYTPESGYKAYVKPDYRKNLPAAINNVIQNISVVQDNQGVHYYVDFINATYRGYDLSRLELFYQPESDYIYDVLYFKNDNFVELKPIFKTTMDDLDNLRGGEFNVNSRSVMCYLGL